MATVHHDIVMSNFHVMPQNCSQGGIFQPQNSDPSKTCFSEKLPTHILWKRPILPPFPNINVVGNFFARTMLPSYLVAGVPTLRARPSCHGLGQDPFDALVASRDYRFGSGTAVFV